MSWLDKLFGAPTPERVARDVTQALRERGATNIRTELARGEIRFEVDGGPAMMNLGNLVHEMERSKRAARPEVLRRFVQSVFPAQDRVPATYESARPRLMPVIRGRAGMGLHGLQLLESADKPVSDRPAMRPFAGDLVIVLVCDSETSMAYVNESQLAAWGVGFDQALDDALQNLRGLPEAGGWQQLGDGVWSGEWGDSYESSRILLPDLIHRVGIAAPVVTVPFRNGLLLTREGNEAGLARMAQTMQASMDDNPRWLSFQPLRLDGTQWIPVDVGGDRRAWRMMALRGEAQTYAEQKQLLDARHERAAEDIFVANFQVLERKDSGLHSFAIWGDGVDSLLPRTDLVVLARKEGDGFSKLVLPWDRAAELAGDLLEATDHEPARFRARRFPDAQTLARLQSHALPD